MRIGMNEDMGGHIDSGDEGNNAQDKNSKIYE
jgi:hypothetical protein